MFFLRNGKRKKPNEKLYIFIFKIIEEKKNNFCIYITIIYYICNTNNTLL